MISISRISFSTPVTFRNSSTSVMNPGPQGGHKGLSAGRALML